MAAGPGHGGAVRAAGAAGSARVAPAAPAARIAVAVGRLVGFLAANGRLADHLWQPFCLPQGGDFMRWREPALMAVFFSDWHGLFTWTPVVALAIAGTVGSGVATDWPASPPVP